MVVEIGTASGKGRSALSSIYCLIASMKGLPYASALYSEIRNEALQFTEQLIPEKEQQVKATEQQIQSAIEEVIKGRTSVVIAHRLSTVRNADIILVVKDGKIIERGKHDELLKAGGYYCRLYERQYEDEATDSVFTDIRA